MIESQKLTINEVLSEEKIKDLAAVLKDFTGESLGELMEMYPNQFTWNELKMYRASEKVSQS